MKSVLVLRSALLGDFILAVPALGMLRKAFPGRRIVLLTIQTGSLRRLASSYSVEGSSAPWVNLVVPHLVDDVFTCSLSLADINALAQRLSSFSFEAGVLMLDPCAPWFGRLKKMLLMWWLLRLAPLYGWRGPGSLGGERSKLKKQGFLKHHVHGPLQFLSELSPPIQYDETVLRFDLRLPVEACDWAAAWLGQRGLLGVSFAVIAPGSVQHHKQWPLKSFALLVQRLLFDYPELRVLVMGTNNDRPLGEYLRALNPIRVFNSAGESSIAQAAALLSRAKLVVGNDGGAMHLGDAMGRKVVSILPGIEFPDSVEPWNNKDLAVRWEVPCAPCYSFTVCPQGHRRCMLDLPVDLVWEKCKRVLDGDDD